MKKKLLIVLLLAFCLAYSSDCVYGQSKTREIGLRLEAAEQFKDFDFIYKRSRKKENKFMRYSLANLQILAGDGGVFGGAIGFNIGWENRKTIAPKVQFVHGFEPGFVLSPSIIEVKLGYVLGLQYSLSEELFVNIETVPSASVALTPSAYNYRLGGLSNVALGVGYTFTKLKKSRRKK